MSSTLVSNDWGEIIHHEADRILELRWLPSQMTDGGFKATLALFAWEAEKFRPRFLLIDPCDELGVKPASPYSVIDVSSMHCNMSHKISGHDADGPRQAR